MIEKIKLSKKALDALKDLANKRGDSLDETIRHCINTEIYMNEQLVRGNRVLCQEPDGTLWKIVFSHIRKKF